MSVEEKIASMEKVEAHQNSVDRSRKTSSVNIAKCSLECLNLTYNPGHNSVISYAENLVKTRFPAALHSLVASNDNTKTTAPLINVNFKAMRGQITAIVGPDEGERRTLIELLMQHRKYGIFNGSVVINGSEVGVSYARSIAAVPRKSLYLPGLTYTDTLVYAAWLRMDLRGVKDKYGAVHARVKDVLEVMGIYKCRHRMISERPSNRGELGGDLRRLSIAMEIIDLPPVIILDEPCAGIDPSIAVGILESLKLLADNGHVIVCSLDKPGPQIFSFVDSLVLLSNGYSIYSGPVSAAESFFCSAELGYFRRKNTDLVDFLVDIASGTERSAKQRVNFTSEALAVHLTKFQLYAPPKIENECVYANAESLSLYGYAPSSSFSEIFFHSYFVTKRAIYIKFHEYEVIKKNLGSSAGLGLIMGYLLYKQGNFGYYTMSFFGLPYVDVSNVTGSCFIMPTMLTMLQVLNVHILVQKVHVFRYEQASNSCTGMAFALATLIAETPFTIVYSLIFAHIMYFMIIFQYGYDNYYYFMELCALIGILGQCICMFFSSLFKKEVIVRDAFLICTFLQLMTSGFPFQFPTMPAYMKTLAVINPGRWMFEALMVLKYKDKKDGVAYLTPYSWQQFDKETIFVILPNFIIVTLCFFMLTLLPRPNLLKKLDFTGRNEKERSSSGELLEDNTGRESQLQQRTSIVPVLFSKMSSVGTGRASLSIHLSQQGEAETSHGPTVTLKEVCCRVRDPKSPVGYTTVLDTVSGRFDWGKLSMVLGAAGSGKSSLLHILAGDVGYDHKVSGSVLFNGEDPGATGKELWQRCAFVECHDEHYRDLSVREVITYAMKLRCLNRKGVSVVAENVSRTLDILDLNSVADKKTKHLSAGDKRRLSIGEEIVHGPSLLLIDEPSTDLDVKDVSTLLMTFREMVNQDKTVVCAMHKPSSEAFRLFDTLLLLCKGRVVYHGPIDNAIKFFVDSPFSYKVDSYENPAEFLLDVSACVLVEGKGSIITPAELNRYYMESEQFEQYRPQQSASSESSNPMLGKSSFAMSVSSQDEGALALNRGMQDGDGSTVAPKVSTRKPESRVVTSFRLYSMLLGEYFTSLHNTNWDNHFFKMGVLLRRSSMVLWHRTQLVLGSCALFIIIAGLFCWMLGDVSSAVYNITSFFAIGMVLLMFTNVQLVFFLFHNNQVFLKEHSRGLYSSVQQWQTCSPGLWLMRVLNTSCYGLMCYYSLGLKDLNEARGFFFLTVIVGVVASTMLTEAVMFSASSIRTGYQVIPGVVFVNFVFSGLMIKPVTLPNWLGWAPAATLCRWVLQAQILNQFDGDTGAFPYIDLFNYSTYDAYLSLFGFGGKTKWYCFYMILINIFVFRLLTLLMIVLKTHGQKGLRQFKKVEEADKMY